MIDFIPLIAICLTGVVLLLGIINLAFGGNISRKYSVPLMFLRIMMQLLSVCLLTYYYLHR